MVRRCQHSKNRFREVIFGLVPEVKCNQITFFSSYAGSFICWYSEAASLLPKSTNKDVSNLFLYIVENCVVSAHLNMKRRSMYVELLITWILSPSYATAIIMAVWWNIHSTVSREEASHYRCLKGCCQIFYVLAQWIWGQVYWTGCNLQPHSYFPPHTGLWAM